jgi:hypothetical protein
MEPIIMTPFLHPSTHPHIVEFGSYVQIYSLILFKVLEWDIIVASKCVYILCMQDSYYSHLQTFILQLLAGSTHKAAFQKNKYVVIFS